MQEKRQYIRMDTVFPVEFKIFSGDGQKKSPYLFQGFTRDVSEAGLCVEFKSFGKDTELKLLSKDIFLDLIINPSFSTDSIRALGKIAWLRKQELPAPERYFIGVSYQEIDVKSQKLLIFHAKKMKWIPRAAAGVLIFLTILSLVIWAINQKLELENKVFLENLRQNTQSKSKVTESLIRLTQARKKLELDLINLDTENKKLSDGLEKLDKENLILNTQSLALSGEILKQKNAFEEQLAKAKKSESEIRGQIEGISAGQKQLRESFRYIHDSSGESEKRLFKKMSDWILSHQNKRSGLVTSYEGDHSLEDMAFTYDQSLASQVFVLTQKYSNAKAILNFFESNAKNKDGIFYNAYDVYNGAPREDTANSGPSIWIGIAALQYENKVHDGRFVALAERIGESVLRMQDEEGGVSGGPESSWFSTEHQLDAYAFFNMLHQVKGDQKYLTAQNKILSWLQKYAYSVRESRLNRGKGDGTIATDTLAWAIASIGPSKLLEMGFDPEGILAFAENNCQAKAKFNHPSGKQIEIRGFDFAKTSSAGRGAIVSGEWTAQMVVSYQIMARHFEAAGDMEKSSQYREKSAFYLNELQKMVITSPSKTGQGYGCLPYATIENADTGHGWRTPKGAFTGSLSATAYAFFAWKEYNPFDVIEEGSKYANL